ncbi:MAG: helix-turn-helix domain-containing protein [Bacteroidota bacterium]
MVSLRCKLFVKDTLTKLGIPHGPVELGEVELLSEISVIQLEQIKIDLLSAGFEILEDHKSILIEKIKTIIIQMVQYDGNLPKINFSAYLTAKLPYDYTYLANIFSEVKGTTIERFIIMHKIERIKELLLYNELSLTEISYKLNYSSVAHLSAQFKKITGLTPTEFKRQKNKHRSELEDL